MGNVISCSSRKVLERVISSSKTSGVESSTRSHALSVNISAMPGKIKASGAGSIVFTAGFYLGYKKSQTGIQKPIEGHGQTKEAMKEVGQGQTKEAMEEVTSVVNDLIKKI